MLKKSDKDIHQEVTRALFQHALEELKVGLEGLREDQAISHIREAMNRFIASRTFLERGLEEFDRGELLIHFSDNLKLKKSEVEVLSVIWTLQHQFNEPVAASEIIERSKSSRSGIYGAIRSCTSRGYLDLNKRLYKLTPEGEQIISAIQENLAKYSRAPQWNTRQPH